LKAKSENIERNFRRSFCVIFAPVYHGQIGSAWSAAAPHVADKSPEIFSAWLTACRLGPRNPATFDQRPNPTVPSTKPPILMHAPVPGIGAKPGPYWAHDFRCAAACGFDGTAVTEDFGEGFGSANVWAAALQVSAGMAVAAARTAAHRILPADRKANQRSMRRILARFAVAGARQAIGCP
jgi:hypothetical protein